MPYFVTTRNISSGTRHGETVFNSTEPRLTHVHHIRYNCFYLYNICVYQIKFMRFVTAWRVRQRCDKYSLPYVKTIQCKCILIYAEARVNINKYLEHCVLISKYLFIKFVVVFFFIKYLRRYLFNVNDVIAVK